MVTKIMALRIDHDDDDDEEEVNRTQRFEPGAASTPYHNGEQIGMQPMEHEQTGLPDTSYEETPLLGSIDNLFNESDISRRMRKAIYKIKTRFPKANFENLKT